MTQASAPSAPTIAIPRAITVAELAELTNVTAVEVIKRLMTQRGHGEPDPDY